MMSVPGAKDNNPLQLGWIPYWNLLPLKRELLRSVKSGLSLQAGHPTQVNRWLADGVVDAAPCSSICLIKSPGNEMALPIGVASDGPVQSVYLGIHGPTSELVECISRRNQSLREVFDYATNRYPNDVRLAGEAIWKNTKDLKATTIVPPPVRFTPASAASATLAKVLYRLWFGDDALRGLLERDQNISLSPDAPSLELLIGDEALARRSEFRQVLDLGAQWKDLTRLPFVYAVWQTQRKSLSTSWRKRISDAAELAQARMTVEPTDYIPDVSPEAQDITKVDLASYWRDIQYRLTPQHIRGLLLYLSLARQLWAPEIDHQTVVKLMRWQEMGRDYND